VVIHFYRHRLGLAPGYPPYEDIERRLAAQPVIGVPAITLDGLTDGNYPATDGSATAAKFHGPRNPPPGSGRRSQPAAGSSKGICRRGHGIDESRLIVPES
jgi:hypothetical protein